MALGTAAALQVALTVAERLLRRMELQQAKRATLRSSEVKRINRRIELVRLRWRNLIERTDTGADE